MSELKRIAEDIRSAFAESGYPAEFLRDYDQMECLASRSGRETFLVRSKATGDLAVAKCYMRAEFPLRPDGELLASLSGDGLPRFYAQYRNEKMLCVVREYIEGVPLSRYARERQLTVGEIRTICVRLCDILAVLHGHRPPVVHRDIKPENIIVRPDGEIALIDFEISRAVRQEAEADTVCFGTRGYAPPEQYGFSQTDTRADIYAVGVLLRFLITGSVRANPNIAVEAGLQRVIDRCTAFSPEARYRTVGQVKAALLTPGKRRPAPRTVLRRLLMAALALAVGFALGRYTGLFSAARGGSGFSEPLVEAAARAQLGLDADAPLTEALLLGVRRIYIYGTRVFQNAEDFYRCTINESVRGQLSSLQDVRLLPNLEELHVVHQGGVDISALPLAQNLYTVELKHLRLRSAEALKELPGLKHAMLFDAGVTDVTALSACGLLETLDVGLNPIESMAAIGAHKSLRSLYLNGLRLPSLDGLERMERLQTLSIRDAEIADLTALRSLADLKTVYIDAAQAEAVAGLLNGTQAQSVLTD